MHHLDRLSRPEHSSTPAVDPRQLLHDNHELRHAYLDFYKRRATDTDQDIATHGTTAHGTVVICTTRDTDFYVSSFCLQTQVEQEYAVIGTQAIGERGHTDLLLALQAQNEAATHLLLLSKNGNEWKQGSDSAEKLADMRATTAYLPR